MFHPAADALIDQAHPNQNYGTAPFLATFPNPGRDSYLRFQVSGLSGSVQSATLRLWAILDATQGVDVRGVSDNSWGETTITWNNAPSWGAVAGSSGGFDAGWVEIDVTSLVSGNGAVSMALTPLTLERCMFTAREDAVHPPELKVISN